MTVSPLEKTIRNENQPDIGIQKKKRAELAEMTRQILADTYVLMVKTQAVHWNIAGPLFKSVHDMTEDQYRDMFEAIDDLAERVRALGGQAPLSYEEMSEMADLLPLDSGAHTAQQMLNPLSSDHEQISRRLAEGSKAAAEAGDPATEDLFVERLRVHEKNAWMLRALLAS